MDMNCPKCVSSSQDDLVVFVTEDVNNGIEDGTYDVMWVYKCLVCRAEFMVCGTIRDAVVEVIDEVDE